LKTAERILVVGASGFLGNSLLMFHEKSESFGLSGISKKEIVLTSKDGQIKTKLKFNYANLAKVILEVKPKTILNASGLVGDKICELYPEAALEANVELPSMLATIANDLEIQLIHFSTDAVFGQHQKNRCEEVIPSQDTVYGKTKLEGEERVTSLCSKALIVRTNFVGLDYQGNRGLFDFFAGSFEKDKEVIGYSNVLFNPISLKYLHRNVNKLKDRQAIGVFHLAGKTKLTKYDFGRLILESVNENSLGGRNLISPCTVSEGSRLDMTLETPKMRKFNLQYGDIESEVRRMYEERKRRLPKK